MNLLLVLAFILNLIIIITEIWVLGKIRKKINILKYYTFLQNFLALLVSFIFCCSLIINTVCYLEIPEFIKGIRYVATVGLVAIMIIYVLFLSSKEKNLLCEEDFKLNFDPKKANFLLHYFCPIISLVSFVLLERTINLSQVEWTLYVAIPSCLYWGMYVFLSVTKLWNEPYEFVGRGEKNFLIEILIIMMIPVLFILISYVIWYIR